MLKLIPLVALVGSSMAAALPVQPPAKKPATAAAKKPAAAPKVVEPKATIRFVAEGEGNVARYRVRERLVGKELDNDAVGETKAVTGSIVLDQSNRVMAGESGFTVTLAGLTSDQARRDGFVSRRLLVTDSFPTTTFKVTAVQGLPAKLPTSGSAEFQLVGDLTVKSVTRPATWNVKATIAGDKITGQAVTRFTFADYKLTQPKVPIVLSVVDTIALEYDFSMTKKTP